MTFAGSRPDTYQANRWLAQCYETNGRKDLAIVALRKLLEFEKDPQKRAEVEGLIKRMLD